MSRARLGNGALSAALAGGRFRREQVQAFHPFSGDIKTAEGANVGHHGDGHGTWPPTQGLQGLDHGMQTPRWPRFLQCRCQALEALGMLTHGPAVCLKDEVLRRPLPQATGDEPGSIWPGPCSGYPVCARTLGGATWRL